MRIHAHHMAFKEWILADMGVQWECQTLTYYLLRLSDQIIGLQPDEEKHKNYFLLEPKMAMPVCNEATLQKSTCT